MKQIPLKYLLFALIVLLGLGFGLMTAGLLYDIAYAGIPPQDAPPEVAAEFAANARTASIFYMAGGVFSALGSLVALGTAVVAIWRMVRRPSAE